MQLEISLMQKAFMQLKEGLIKLRSRDLSRAKLCIESLKITEMESLQKT